MTLCGAYRTSVEEIHGTHETHNETKALVKSPSSNLEFLLSRALNASRIVQRSVGRSFDSQPTSLMTLLLSD